MAPRWAGVFVCGLLCARLSVAPAIADDFSTLGIETAPPPAPAVAPGPDTYVNFLQEVRVGVYAHNWIHDENSPVDLSAEILSSPIGYPNNIGAMINTGGKTSYGFTGLTWRIPIYKAFFFEGEFGGALNDAPTHPEEGRVDAGCRLDFRESGGFGYQFNEHVDVIVNIEHISHASFCTHINPGLTQVGARIGYKF